LLHFWATWCSACAVDMVALQRASEQCSADTVRIVLVNVGDSEPDIERYFDRYGVQLPLLLDPEGEAFRDFGGRGLPMNVEWSKGRLATDVEPRSKQQWRDRLTELGCAVSS
jgi:peroxiredoxin